MSTYTVNSRDMLAIIEACLTINRAPADMGDDQAGSVTLTFDPDLTPEQDAQLLERIRRIEERITITRPELSAFVDDLLGLRQYHGLNSPTNAQTAQAVKGLIRVVRALLR